MTWTCPVGNVGAFNSTGFQNHSRTDAHTTVLGNIYLHTRLEIARMLGCCEMGVLGYRHVMWSVLGFRHQ